MRKTTRLALGAALGPAFGLCGLVFAVALVHCDKTSEVATSTSSAPAASTPQALAEAAPPVASATATAMAPAVAPAPAPFVPPGPGDAIVAQHVLIAYRGAKRAPKGVTRTKAEAKARAQEARAKVRAGTAFEDVVDTYSDDTGSVGRLGSVGKFHRGDMDAAFSRAAFALRVEEVSDVVETPFGFHLIKRTQ